jgi:hypothetical protein
MKRAVSVCCCCMWGSLPTAETASAYTNVRGNKGLSHRLILAAILVKGKRCPALNVFGRAVLCAPTLAGGVLTAVAFLGRLAAGGKCQEGNKEKFAHCGGLPER